MTISSAMRRLASRGPLRHCGVDLEWRPDDEAARPAGVPVILPVREGSPWRADTEICRAPVAPATSTNVTRRVTAATCSSSLCHPSRPTRLVRLAAVIRSPPTAASTVTMTTIEPRMGLILLPAEPAEDSDTRQRQHGEEHCSGQRRADQRRRARLERNLAHGGRERRRPGRTHRLACPPTLLCGEQRAAQRADESGGSERRQRSSRPGAQRPPLTTCHATTLTALRNRRVRSPNGSWRRSRRPPCPGVRPARNPSAV